MLSHVGYDLPTRTLEVRTNTGQIMRYLGVPRSVYAALIGVETTAAVDFDWVQSRYPIASVS